MKYINTDELKAFIDAGKYRNPCERVFSENDIIDMVNEMPPADVVEVVRCKNCKYREKSFYGNRRDYCEKRSTLEHTEYVNPTDFCSKGDRKETNG